MPSLNMPTAPTPGVPSSLMTASGIADAALVNIGGEIRRQSYGRTIAGGMRLGRFVGLKGEGEIRGILDAATKAQLNQYIQDRLGEGYSRMNQNTLVKDMGGGVKQVISIDWSTGALSSSTAPTTEALKAQKVYEQAVKKSKGYIESESLRAVLGEEGYYKNLAGQTKDPIRKQEYLALADKAAGRVLQQQVATGEVGRYSVGGQLMSMAPDVAEKMSKPAFVPSSSDTINRILSSRLPLVDIAPLISSSTVSTPPTISKSKTKSGGSAGGYSASGISSAFADPFPESKLGFGTAFGKPLPKTTKALPPESKLGFGMAFGKPLADITGKSRVFKDPLKHFLKKRRW